MASRNHGVNNLYHRDTALCVQQRRRTAPGERRVPTRHAVHAPSPRVSDDTHVRVDISTADAPRSNRLGLIWLVTSVFIAGSWVHDLGLTAVREYSWHILEGSSEVGGIPGVFLLKTLIPLTGVLLFCQGIAGVAAFLLAKLQ